MIKKYTVKISALAVVLLIIIAAVYPVFATEESTAAASSTTAAASVGTNSVGDTYALTDDAAVFTEAQAQELINELKAAGEKTGWQFIIHTSTKGVSADNMVSQYDQYYESQNFKDNAIMLVIDMGTNNRNILSYGDVKSYFAGDASRYEDIKSAMKPYLNMGDMYGASQVFIAKAQKVYDMGKTNKLLLSLKKYGIFIALAGIIVGLIIFFVTKSKYKHMGTTGTYDLSANSSVDLTDVADDFVTTHTTVHVIKSDSNSGGGSSSPSRDGHSSGTF